MTGLTNLPPQADDVDTHAAAHYAGGADPIDLSELGAIPALEKGKAGGVATLGTDGKVPSGQLPTFDVIGQFQSHNADKTAHGDIRTLASNAQTAADEAKAAAETAQAQVAKAATWELIDKIDNTVGYSGEWTAPDVFGDGQSYDLGVYMIGGGGSGGRSGDSGSDYLCSATGGASGYGKNFVVEKVNPGDHFPWVIGTGGVISGTSFVEFGVAGGSTSFAQIIANGGEGGRYTRNKDGFYASGVSGGQGTDCISGLSAVDISPRELFGCGPTTSYSAGSVHVKGGLSQSPKVGQNQFDSSMTTLCAGGWARAYTNNDMAGVIIAMPDGTKGGDGAVNAPGQNATGYGNGGGGCAFRGSTALQSGAGSDGVIYLYARKAVSE